MMSVGATIQFPNRTLPLQARKHTQKSRPCISCCKTITCAINYHSRNTNMPAITRDLASQQGIAMVIMGVSGSGKSTIGHLLAETISCDFFDADDFHSQENKDKMRRGVPLTDTDRMPWLKTLRDTLRDYIKCGRVIVLACSALQPLYRNILRSADKKIIQKCEAEIGEVKQECHLDSRNTEDQDDYISASHTENSIKFFLLHGSADLFKSRIEQRFDEGSHFMPPSLLQSQMDSLKVEENEGIILLDASLPPVKIVNQIKEMVCNELPPQSQISTTD